MEKINIITMGCSKNLVDSEHLMQRLKAAGIEALHDARLDEAPTVIVNTCGFIRSAREESLDMILQCVQAKNKGVIERLFVIGCLSEVYKKDLEKEIPEVDSFFGVKSMDGIIRLLAGDRQAAANNERALTTPSHYAYLKIAEGCDRTCAFCAIPHIRGRHVSLSLEDVEAEARFLSAGGVKELLVISQDVTYYGLDNYKKQMLPTLTQRLCRIDGIRWLRLHYAYPQHFPLELLDLMLAEPKICRYIDIPVQHISDKMLSKMRRNITGAETMRLMEQIRTKIPDIALRTTLIVGHPGETDKDFEQLLAFVEQMRFDRLGVFTYSHEENTYAAAHYSDRIPQKVKQARADRIMEVQKNISEELNRQKIGKTFTTVIDREEGDYFIGRTEYDSPEVDTEVLIAKTDATCAIGNFYPVRISDASEYDLYGQIVKKTS
ncbi:MAG: 30S ribosomal protein S12 methylthiotransferase RimO [Bacteroidales bacterium]|nr:30S ribosomal protein S12 methylthiotransferase RimO [Bacteroidales bacterium]